MSKWRTAVENNSQYYTPLDSSRWCLERLRDYYGDSLDEMTLLEPCVGRGSFVLTARELGIRAPWVTMDLYPAPEFTPDYVADFRSKVPEFDPQSVDLVVTNPPFGDACATAKAMVKHAAKTYGRTAMLLPIGCRRPSFLDGMPRDCRLVFDYDVPAEEFDLPDGSVRKVKTIFQLWVREEGYERELLLEDAPLAQHYSVQYGGSPNEGHELGMCVWGSVGRTFVPGERNYKKQCFWEFHTDTGREAFQRIQWGEYGKEWSNSVITLSLKDLYTEMNKAIREMTN